MTDKLLCPVCDKPIEIDDVHLFYVCKNKHCVLHNVGGDLKMWQMFANTMKERNLSYDDNISLAGKLDIAVSQLKKTRDYIEDCRYQETNYFLVDSKDASIILDETNETLEQINNKEEK